jgi:hypothetical protein
MIVGASAMVGLVGCSSGPGDDPSKLDSNIDKERQPKDTKTNGESGTKTPSQGGTSAASCGKKATDFACFECCLGDRAVKLAAENKAYDACMCRIATAKCSAQRAVAYCNPDANGRTGEGESTDTPSADCLSDDDYAACDEEGAKACAADSTCAGAQKCVDDAKCVSLPSDPNFTDTRPSK